MAQVESLYSSALNLLNDLVARHESKKEDSWHRVRLVRAYSERAALNLFVFVSLQLSKAMGNSIRSNLPDTPFLQEAYRDLVRAYEGFSDGGLEDSKANPVRQQCLFNFACYEVLRFTFEEQPFRLSPFVESIKPEIGVIHQSLEGKVSPIVDICTSAFFLLCEDDIAENFVRIEQAASNESIQELVLDSQLSKRIFDAIETRFPFHLH